MKRANIHIKVYNMDSATQDSFTITAYVNSITHVDHVDRIVSK